MSVAAAILLAAVPDVWPLVNVAGAITKSTGWVLAVRIRLDNARWNPPEVSEGIVIVIKPTVKPVVVDSP